MTETYAGMLARTLPELDSRELSALVCENQHAWGTDGPRAWWAIRDRAEDAQALAWASLHHGPGSNAYWAAIP